MALHQFDYIFAIAMIFAFLDAWNIGANDVANSFASSVSSRSLKYWQAMILAAIMEFLGAVLVGSRVSDTIRNKIVDVSVYEKEPAVLMLTMSCALIGSSTWLTIATSIGMPVSTTHSIVGAVIGSSIAAKGAHNILWGWSGVAQIIASWFIAPLIAGCFATIIFLISKYAVLEIKDPRRSLKNAMYLVPCLVFTTFSILTMLIVWKGSPKLKLNDLSTGTTCGAIFGVGGVAAALYMLFLFPYFNRKLIHEDWTLKWYDVLRGPIFYFKSTDNIPPRPEGHELTIDYYEGRRYDEAGNLIEKVDSIEEQETIVKEGESSDSDHGDIEKVAEPKVKKTTSSAPKHKHPRGWKEYKKLFKQPSQYPYLLFLLLTNGVRQDVIHNQASSKDILAGDLKKLHTSSKYYDNKIEYMYSLLQAITACTMSFAHGANDIANATGPLATVYLTWSTNTTASKAEVPVWVLCYAASALVIGLWTFGYRIMANLGNKLILQSPSRGFSLELGAAITTVMATQLKIPVSTTQSAVGATVFVGLCNKEWKSVNWRMVAWCYLGWIFTLPCAGLIAGILNGIILNAPSKGITYTM
ncbi:phosphate permease PHO89 [Spathaspora passalidarum NRRL Y-27907]|uniref:Phosphate transporter n=1 Tax=Spathaspora passalidarum (strain NRRL Y-27907 / 11-Y1) TaxID=619300 RepID=G3AFX0_SPAPN|nr:phosphate permease PHO89 [Spathaspora passalidarum NRRL Y-27907]EGW35109.1 phosphate permease PHO89 [Spathaspora passalidarum NRRL Y-27907]